MENFSLKLWLITVCENRAVRNLQPRDQAEPELTVCRGRNSTWNKRCPDSIGMQTAHIPIYWV